MATDVSYLVRAMALGNKNDETALMTRDLLGESFTSSCSKIDDSQELDLDLKVPIGWEKRLDLKSGKVYLQKCSSQPSRSATKPLQENKSPKIKRSLNTMEETNLDLKLVSSPKSLNNNSSVYQSVCTIDKVKSALDRAKNEQIRKMFFPRSSKSPSTNSSSSTKVTFEIENEVDEKSVTSMSQQQGLLSAAGCPNCLMYVMISKVNPKCPKCNSTVSLPVMKKPRIDLDLNLSI
ncbi:unnamed protein product [Rhodiola kirilowii]